MRKDYYTKVLKIYLNPEQKERAEKILSEANTYFNTCLECRHIFLDKYKEHIKENNIDKKFYPFWKFCEEFEYDKFIDEKIVQYIPDFYTRPKKERLPRDVKDKIKIYIEFVVKMYFEKVYKTLPNFKQIKKGNLINKFYLANGHKNIRFNPENRNEIKIPYLGFIRIANSDYLLDDEVNNIAAGHLQRDIDNSYNLILVIKIDKNNDMYHQYITDLDDGIGIDLGIRKYAVIAGKAERIYEDPYKLYPKLLKDYEDAKKLIGIANKKINMHIDKNPNMDYNKIMTDIVYRSKSIQRLYAKRRKKLKRIDNRMKGYIRSIITDIVTNIKPKFITIETINTHDMRKHSGRALMEQIYMRKFSLFRRLIMDACRKYGIELRLAEPCYPSSKICSKCGRIRENFSNQEVFRCKYDDCHNVMDRDLNAAMNLYQLDKEFYNVMEL